MSDPLSPVRAEILVDALRHNVRALVGRTGQAEAVGVVKADAYGHGAARVADVLARAGVRRLAVATVAEALALRAAGHAGPLHVFGAPWAEQLPAFEAHGLTLTVSSPDVARDVAESGLRLTVHVKVDTGMHRLGVAPADVPEAARVLRAAPGVDVEGLWTHLATADGSDLAFAAEQVGRFAAVLRALGGDAPPLVHVANGPAALRLVPALAPALRPLVSGPRALARLGGALYGLASDRALDAAMRDLRPAMRLVARVVHVQTVARGESVSYGRAWTAERPTSVATVAAGYADGVPRGLSSGGWVGLGGACAPVVGRVCMDMLMVAVPEGVAARRGDEAVLFGPGGPRAEEAARAAGTLSYALTSGLTARVPRVDVGA